jgi:hypothetical protein
MERGLGQIVFSLLLQYGAPRPTLPTGDAGKET